MEKYILETGKGTSPLYAQVKEILLKEIKDGKYKEKIPTEKELQEMFSVSRITIRQAVDELVAEGYLVRERAKGTRIIQKKISENMDSLRNFSNEMKSKNIQYQLHDLEIKVIKANAKVAEALEIAENSNVFYLRKVYYVEGAPFCSIYSYLPSYLNLSIDEEIYKKSLYEYLEREKNIIVSKSYEDIEVGFADENLGRELCIKPGSAVLFRSRRSFDQNGNHVEYSLSYYRAEKYKYSLVLKK